MFGWHDSSILPTPLAELHPDFISNFGRPAGLWLPCDGAENKAYDLAGNDAKNPGALNGGITTVPGGFGTLGAAWQTNGSTGQVTGPALTNFFPFPYTGPISFLVWCNPSSVGGFVPVFDIAGRQLSLFIGGGFYGIGGTSTAYTPSKSFTANEWQLCGVSSSGAANSGQIIRNNQIVSSGLGVGSSFDNTIQFGLNPSSGGSVVPIKYGAAFLFKSQLSVAQVSTLYSCLLTGEPFPLFAADPLERAYGYAASSGGGAAKPPPPELLYGRAA